MSAYGYTSHESLDTPREDMTYTISKMKVNAMAAPYVSIFEDLRAECTAVQAEEVTLNDKRSEARARVHAVGESTCALARRFCKEVLTLTGEQREHSLYTLYFGDKNFTDFKKPLLNGDFDGVRGWLIAIEATPHASLKPFSAQLKALLESADDALKAREEVDHARKLFRKEGARKQFFDKVNAARKQVHGELSKLPFQHVGLPRDFADRFFTTRRRSNGAVPAPTVESVKEEMDALKAELAAKEQLLEDLEAEAEEAKEKEAEIKAEEAAIEALEKQAVEAAAQAAKRKAKLAAAKKSLSL